MSRRRPLLAMLAAALIASVLGAMPANSADADLWFNPRVWEPSEEVALEMLAVLSLVARDVDRAEVHRRP